MPVAIRPDVSEETLRQLLAEGHESAQLDYKSSCDLSNHDEILEIVKDIAAMQILGGYIVIGADDHGGPTDMVTANHIRLFEQASLRAKVRKFVPEPFDLRSKHHNIEGHDYILVYVANHLDGFVVIQAVGNSRSGQCVFRPGEVFARHGTASERWNQHDITAIRKHVVDREKDRWLGEFTEAFAARMPSETTNAIASGPARALTWHLDNDTFLDVVIEQLRKQDTVPLKLFLMELPSQVGSILTEVDADERLSVILDRLTCLAALLLRLDQDDLYRSVIEAFVAIYKSPVDNAGVPKNELSIQPAQLWFMVQQRLIGIGALAERLKKWESIRSIVLQKGRGYDFEHYPNWYRHALTMAARANLLQLEQDGRTIRSSLLAFAQLQVERLACLRSDIPADDEELLNSLCRFDVLASLVGIDDAGLPDSSAFYPNFAKFYSSRSTPAVSALLHDDGMRQVLFRGSDEKLAEALRELNRRASSEASGITGWNGFQDQQIEDFITIVKGNIQG
jgi:hypothetical protein